MSKSKPTPVAPDDPTPEVASVTTEPAAENQLTTPEVTSDVKVKSADANPVSSAALDSPPLKATGMLPKFPSMTALGFRRLGDSRKRTRTRRLADLARETKTQAITVACLKQAHNLTDDSPLTLEDFLRLRDEWLAAAPR